MFRNGAVTGTTVSILAKASKTLEDLGAALIKSFVVEGLTVARIQPWMVINCEIPTEIIENPILEVLLLALESRGDH